MKSAVEEPRAEKAPSVCSRMCGSCATCLGKEVKEAAHRVEKGVNDAKAAITEKVDDGVAAARRSLKRSRYAVEDGLEEAAHNIRQHPFGAVAIGFAAGAALGLLIPRFGRK
ncbi:MAG: hypothetical protein LAP61_28040 [Acidobacteriia bacterium]|nr:hypothetical protein [Terriglobia bacterium]